MDSLPTREKLLNAAGRLFLELGYLGASMEQVRQAAGVSNGSLYHHFPTKAQLVEALYVETISSLHAALLASIAHDIGAEAGIKGLVRAQVNWVVKHPDRASLLQKLRRGGEVTAASESVSAANMKALGAVKEWMHRKIEAGEMRALPFHLCIAFVSAPVMWLTNHWVKEAKPSVSPKVRAAIEHAAWMAVAP